MPDKMSPRSKGIRNSQESQAFPSMTFLFSFQRTVPSPFYDKRIAADVAGRRHDRHDPSGPIAQLVRAHA